MKKIINIFLIICITFLIVNIFNINKSLSTSLDILEEESIKIATINPSDYEPGTIDSSDVTQLTSKAGYILGFIRNIGVVVSVVMLTIIGVKYMFGSVQEKANYKASMVPYTIGFVLTICATAIVSFIYNAVR